MAGIGRYTPGKQITGKPVTIRSCGMLQTIHNYDFCVTLGLQSIEMFRKIRYLLCYKERNGGIIYER